MLLALWSGEPESAAGMILLNVGRRNLRARGEAVTQPVAPRRQRAPGWIILIDDLPTLQAQVSAQPELGREVRLHRSVIIEMIASQVGEDPRVETQAVEPSLIEAVGGGLHRDVGHAASHHLGESSLEIDRSRSSE